MRKDEFYTKIALLLNAIKKIRDSTVHTQDDFETIDFMFKFAMACQNDSFSKHTDSRTD